MRESKYQIRQCTQSGCTFTAQNKAGLVNHQRQKHGAAAQEILFCCHCHQNFKQQGYRIIQSSAIKIRTKFRDYVGDNKVLGSVLKTWPAPLTQVKTEHGWTNGVCVCVCVRARMRVCIHARAHHLSWL